MMRSIIDYVHKYLVDYRVAEGVYVDATCGNGYDTLFLAEMLAGKGHIYAFDLQEEGISSTRERTKHYRNISYHQKGHEFLEEVITEEVDGILYNLGYLPGGDKSLVTTGPTTVKSLKQGLRLLKVGGIIGVVVYTEHNGALEEEELVRGYLTSLKPGVAQVMQWAFINKGKGPYALIIEKTGDYNE